MSALLLRDLTVERGGRAVVRDVSVEIPAGQVTALLGPNGAGKSTLVLAVGGVLRPKAGAVLLDDPGAPGASGPPASTDLTGRRPERIRQAGVAIVPEGRRLLPDLTVADNLRVASYALTREQTQAGRDRVLELFPQLTRRLTATARTLSGGEQQMVVLAQALICQPRYLLIDELSLGLAPVVVSRLIPVIAAVAESGTGVLLIEQFATVALGLARHAYIMEGGWIRFSGLASELRDHPDRLRSAYLLRGSNAPGPRPLKEHLSRTGVLRAPASSSPGPVRLSAGASRNVVTASAKPSGSSQKSRWPSSGKVTSRAPGMRLASSLPLRGSTTLSALPCRTSVRAPMRALFSPPAYRAPAAAWAGLTPASAGRAPCSWRRRVTSSGWSRTVPGDNAFSVRRRRAASGVMRPVVTISRIEAVGMG